MTLDAFALAMAAEFGNVAWDEAGDRLDQLGRQVADSLPDAPRATSVRGTPAS